MRFSLALLCVLAACSTGHGVAYPTCIPVRNWTDVEQMNMAADLEQLFSDSMLIPAMQDYSRMRMQARACNGE